MSVLSHSVDGLASCDPQQIMGHADQDDAVLRVQHIGMGLELGLRNIQLGACRERRANWRR